VKIEESPSFLKKRSKRLLFLRRSHDRGPNAAGLGRDRAAGAGIKVFLLLFLQKKKTLPCLPSVLAGPAWRPA
jgi:hypothetical protein